MMKSGSRSPRNIGVVAHDAGGARALLPVVEELRRGGVSIQPLMAGPAAVIWNEEFPAVSEVADSASTEELAAWLVTHDIDLLLSAAGLFNQIEHRARLAARLVRLPVIALLDYWSNYASRFERQENGGAARSWPDRLCVMDEHARREMVRAGFPSGQVIVTGHPDLERTARACTALRDFERVSQRRAAGFKEDALLVAFFSDPFYIGPGRKSYAGAGAIVDAEGHGKSGYTVEDVLPLLVEELDAALAEVSAKAVLVVRPHPSEHDEVLRSLLEQAAPSRVRLDLDRSYSPIHWIQMADAIAGMTSIALLHAGLAGRPAFSIQPGLRDRRRCDTCISNAMGYTHGLFDRGAVREACRAMVRRDWDRLRPRPSHPLPLQGAAAHVASVVLDAWAPGAVVCEAETPFTTVMAAGK